MIGNFRVRHDTAAAHLCRRFLAPLVGSRIGFDRLNGRRAAAAVAGQKVPFIVMSHRLVDGDSLAVLAPPRDPRRRFAFGFARQRHVVALLDGHVARAALVHDIRRYCNRLFLSIHTTEAGIYYYY